MSRAVASLPDLVTAALGVQSRAPRTLIALAGPPASGKSTLAPRLAQALTEAGQASRVVPMDGFHLDDRLLEPAGLLSRKGAPETFDLRGFTRLLEDLAAGGELYYPLFDRNREIALAQAGHVPADCQTVIVEGNYLLLDAPGWRDLARLWDLSIYLPVPPDLLQARLLSRWQAQGLSREAAHRKAMDNDIPNGARVASALVAPDILYQEDPS